MKKYSCNNGHQFEEDEVKEYWNGLPLCPLCPQSLCTCEGDYREAYQHQHKFWKYIGKKPFS